MISQYFMTTLNASKFEPKRLLMLVDVKRWGLSFLLVGLVAGQASGAVTEETRAWVEQRESGGRNVAGKKGERGPHQIREICWREVNRLRKLEGKPIHPFSSAWNVPLNRQYGQEYLEICRQRFVRKYRKEPTRDQIWLLYRRGH